MAQESGGRGYVGGPRGPRAPGRYARHVRVRVIELRILGAVLTGLWIATFVVILFGYRPGGPLDIVVGLAAAGPIVIAVAAVAWPPVARSGRAFSATAWLALAAILLLVPSIAGIVSQLQGRGPQTLLPSLEAAYPWILALLATGIYAGIGVARRRLGDTTGRRRRLIAGIAAGVVMVLVAGSAFAAAAVVNELALGNRPANASRFGPTDPTLEPPPCDGTLDVGPTAVVGLRMDAAIDGTMTGQVSASGVRSGADFRWNGFAATRVRLGQVGFARIVADAWELEAPSRWAVVAPVQVSGYDLDRQLVEVALTQDNRAVAEDHGLAYIEGARARHCRIPLDGATLRRALPEVSLLVGATDISRWGGELDFWVFADGQLGQANGQAGGSAVDLDPKALTAEIRFQLTAIDRGGQVNVQPPG